MNEIKSNLIEVIFQWIISLICFFFKLIFFKYFKVDLIIEFSKLLIS